MSVPQMQVTDVAGKHALPLPARRVLAVLVGAAAVALSAQAAVPLPFTPVPVTLQGLGVLLVGGLLGPIYGLAALVAYLVAGSVGLPVFAGGSAGAMKLIGPTGGYLLAFPVAAVVVGRFSRPSGLVRGAVAALLGMVVIHAGGGAQLAIVTGSPKAALALGAVPFVVVDLIKVLIAGIVISRFAARTRRLI